MSRGQTASKPRAAAPSKGPAKAAAPAKGRPSKGQEQGMKVMATVKAMATKAKIKAVAKEDEKKKAAARGREGGRRSHAGQPAAAARPVGCRRQEDDQAGQEARLRHPRAAQRRAALRGGVLRPDRGRLRDAQRDGHQRGRQDEAEQDEEDKPAEEADDDDDERRRAGRGHAQALPPRPRRSRPSAPTIRCACICARWARWSCSPARAKSRSPSASRPAARR